MNHSAELGICSWSLDRSDPVRAIQLARTKLSVSAIQVGFFSREALDQTDVDALRAALTENGVALVGTFLGFDGEDYTSISSITATGGFLPDDTWDSRWEAVQRMIGITAALDCRRMAVHVGTVPDDDASPGWETLVTRTRQVLDALSESGMSLLLETGREPVSVLVRFVEALKRDNVGINFDPSNLIVYGVDDPVRAVAALRGRIELVHLKDATRSAAPGVDYGGRAELGTGDVQVPRVLSKLRASGYGGPVLLEVPAHDGDLSPVLGALDYLRSMLE